MFVLGTAGHIDHGKSVLVHALTQIDPDRLREEKERGMTIDLGFAWLKLPSGREVGIVDVPGHEHFIRNMLAGVGGIDFALLVVAANEGVMPQTKEHLAILDLLEVRRGIVAITKKDLVDDEWLDLVRMEIEELLAPTALAGAPVIPVSSVTGDGLGDLVLAIDGLLDTLEPRPDRGWPRLPIDRVFTITGSGTIVTGTLLDGALKVGEEVEVVPAGLKTRLRGLQMHKAAITATEPGNRVAANLVGIATSQVQRGDVLTRPGWLRPTTMLSARLRLLPHLARPLRHNAVVNLHTGATEATAKVRLLDKDVLSPGDSAWAQMVLSKSVAVVNGDHFIIRSPMDTLGGGVIVEYQARRLRRFRPAIIQNLEARQAGTPEETVIAGLETKQPQALSQLLKEGHLPSAEVQAVVDALIQQRKIVAVGQGDNRLLWCAAGWEQVAQKATTVVQEYHRKYPARPGIPRVELASRLKLGAHAAEVLQRLFADGFLIEYKASVGLPAHSVQLTPAQQAQIDRFLKALADNPYLPPTDLTPEPDLLNLLVEQGQVAKVSGGVVFSREAYDEMLNQVTALAGEKGRITLAEVRDLFHTSRKYAQAFLEHLDEKKITRRIGDERVLYNKA